MYERLLRRLEAWSREAAPSRRLGGSDAGLKAQLFSGVILPADVRNAEDEPRSGNLLKCGVPEARVELARGCPRWILKPKAHHHGRRHSTTTDDVTSR